MAFSLNRETRRTFWFNLLVVLLIATVLYMLFFISLSWITHHGEEVRIPNVLGTSMGDAKKQMEGMTFEVMVDSAYDPKQKALVVLKQIPDSGSVVKKGRTVFITVNKTIPPLTPMPNLVGLSFRSAEMLLRNNKLIPGDTVYKPDIAQGAVLQQSYNGMEVKAGQMIPQGSKINMVLGDGLGNTEFNVPEVVGMQFDEGVANLMGMGIQYTTIPIGDITDTSSAVIFKQTPRACNEAGALNKIKQGDVMDIFIKQNPTQEELDNNMCKGLGVNSNGGGKPATK